MGRRLVLPKRFMPYQTFSVVNQDFNTSFIIIEEMRCTFIGAKARCFIEQIALLNFLAAYGANLCSHNYPIASLNCSIVLHSTECLCVAFVVWL